MAKSRATSTPSPVVVDPDADTAPAPVEASPAGAAPVLTDDARATVLGWWSIGKPMAAIQVYQGITGADLTTARDAVVSLAEAWPLPTDWSPPGDEPETSLEAAVVFPASEGWTPEPAAEGKVVHLRRPKPEIVRTPAAPPTAKVLDTKTERRKFPMTPDQLRAHHEQLTMLTLESEQMDRRHKSARAEITEERKTHRARISEIAAEANDKAITREVEVVYTAHYLTGELVETIKDTGEVLAVRPLSPSESQVPLFAATKAPTQAPSAEDEDQDADETPDPVN